MAVSKVQLTEELWGEITKEGNGYVDFDDSKETRDRAKKLISEYYTAVAKVSGRSDASGLKASDFNEIITFFKEKLLASAEDLSQIKRVIAMLIYFETWYADEGWLRQDWSLCKLFLAASRGFFENSSVDREAFVIDVFRTALVPEESVLALGKLVVMNGHHHLFRSSNDTDLNRLQEIFTCYSMLNSRGSLEFTFGLNVSQGSKVRAFVEDELAPKLKEAVRNSQLKNERISSNILTVANIVKGAEDQNPSAPHKKGSNVPEEQAKQSFMTTGNSSPPRTANQKNKVEKSKGDRSIGGTMGGLATFGLGIALLIIPGLQVLGIACIVAGVFITVMGVVYPDSKAKVQGNTAQHDAKKQDIAGKGDAIDKEPSNELRHVASGSPKKAGSAVFTNSQSLEGTSGPAPATSTVVNNRDKRESSHSGNFTILRNGLGADCCVFSAARSGGDYPTTMELNASSFPNLSLP